MSEPYPKSKQLHKNKVDKPKKVDHNRGKPKRSKRTKFSNTTRKLIIARDGCLCVRCQRPYHNIHHITLASQGGAGEPENGVCVCFECHELAHRDINVRRWFEEYRDKYLLNAG
jgi:5-methylcytosine-specific restriction endonuclease McrA